METAPGDSAHGNNGTKRIKSNNTAANHRRRKPKENRKNTNEKKKERVMESTEGQLMRITQQRNKESNMATTVSESSKAKGNRKILMEREKK